ncbi:MAG: hypothetical protein RIF33_01600 [Cyclobacteriaceae bacterium]
MNRIYRHIIAIAALVTVMVGCRDEDKVYAPEAVIPVALQATNRTDNTFILQNLDDASFAFTLEYENWDGSADGHPWFVGRSGPVSSLIDATLLVSYNGAAGSFGPAEFGTFSEAEFPVGVQMTPQNLVAALPGLSMDELDGGDRFVVSYEYTIDANNTGDIRELGTPGLDYCGGFTTEGEFCTINIDIVCTSDLATTFDYSTTNLVAGGGSPVAGPVTGTGEFVEVVTGRYTIPDASFGVFAELYSDTPAVGLELVDACEVISIEGSDQYGDSYTFNIQSIDGAVMTISWSNTFSDSGITVLTRTDGSDWPPNLIN